MYQVSDVSGSLSARCCRCGFLQLGLSQVGSSILVAGAPRGSGASGSPLPGASPSHGRGRAGAAPVPRFRYTHRGKFWLQF